MKTKNLYFPYKGRTDQTKEARSRILKEMEKTGFLCIANPSIRTKIVEDGDGDALDSVIAAFATSRALRNGAHLFSLKAKNLYAIEGYIYV